MYVGVHVVIMADTSEQRTDIVIMSETYYVCECEYGSSDTCYVLRLNMAVLTRYIHESKYGNSEIFMPVRVNTAILIYV